MLNSLIRESRILIFGYKGIVLLYTALKVEQIIRD